MTDLSTWPELAFGHSRISKAVVSAFSGCRSYGPAPDYKTGHQGAGAAGMSSMSFLKLEMADALGRGVLQCVTIGSRPLTLQAYKTSTGQVLKMFTVDEEQSSDSDATFVPTQFMSETLVTSLGKTNFNIREPSLFVWLGGTVYRTVESVLASLAFIASLPKGSGVILDYAAKRTSLEPLSRTALDGLACRISMADGTATYFIQPGAVTAMLRGLSFRRIVNSEHGESPQSGLHLVSAVT